MKTPEHIKQLLSRLPSDPGVYKHLDKDGKIIYVGKAKNLKNRVSSYFNKNKYENGKTRLLVSKIDDIKVTVVETELDALLLENSLIKKHQPRYNIALKDDKTYPWIVIKKERFPRVFPTRTMIKDGSEYFGPYANVKWMKALLGLIKQLYKIRTCKYSLTKENVEAGKFKVCLEYHMGNCLGPCVGKETEEHYTKNIEGVRQILKGNYADLNKTLKLAMNELASELKFEEAGEVKKRLEILEHFQAKSTIVNPDIHNVDVFTITSDMKSGFVNYMKVNNGSIIQTQTTELKKRLEESDQELLEFAIIEIRNRFESTSNVIYSPMELDLKLPDVKIHVPQRGDKKKLLDLSMRNALYYKKDRHKEVELTNPEEHQNRILTTLQKDLHLPDLPVHIECFDNSNIQGTNPASACVVFKNAKPSKTDYRKFNIKTVVGPDDFASMREVVFRRYSRLLREGESLPQLVIIDGGKGQLSSAISALKECGAYGKLAVIGIAKRLEEIYFPGDTLPVYINKKSESLKLIQHLRNEAHRFSLSHHRDRRSKNAFNSSLDAIPGVGTKTQAKLLKHFKSVKRIKEAQKHELEKVIGASLGNAVWRYFSENS
ncbi:MAG: excinuclease ABC subunit UvrC [Flavobacteriales bacterium]